VNAPQLQFIEDYWIGYFDAMASRCEVLIDSPDRELAERLTCIARDEALRIQQKFSRYRDDNIIYKINNANGKTVTVDDETAQLLDYADQCHELSDGLFDITSGVLREAWKFDGSDKVPSKSKVKKLLSRIGWHKVQWQSPQIRMPASMEIDLGGIGKEYSVDRSILLLRQETPVACLVNYGGDIATTGLRQNGKGWVVGIERPDSSPAQATLQTRVYELKRGALATSGDARRFLIKDGKRYGHILNPLTGWPVADAPRSVTVITETCTEAGILATLAILQGSGAEAFLEQQDVTYWCMRA
jgi:thiamine biosynthesis lipoprotein